MMLDLYELSSGWRLYEVVGHFGRSLLLLTVTLTVLSGVSRSVDPAKMPLVFESNRASSGDLRYLLREGALKGEFLNDGFRSHCRAARRLPRSAERLVAHAQDVAI